MRKMLLILAFIATMLTVHNEQAHATTPNPCDHWGVRGTQTVERHCDDLKSVTLPEDTPNQVSRSEYDAVKRGWTKARVHNLFDVNGRLATSSPRNMTRIYNATGDHAVFVSYLQYQNGSWHVHGTVYKQWCSPTRCINN